MAKAMPEEGMHMPHTIGPNTPHRYHPDSKIIIDREINAIVAKGRDASPRKIRFTTWTLAYNRMKWVRVDGMGKHWERARMEAEVLNDHAVTVTSSNVTAFTLSMEPGTAPLDLVR